LDNYEVKIGTSNIDDDILGCSVPDALGDSDNTVTVSRKPQEAPTETMEVPTGTMLDMPFTSHIQRIPITYKILLQRNATYNDVKREMANICPELSGLRDSDWEICFFHNDYEYTVVSEKMDFKSMRDEVYATKEVTLIARKKLLGGDHAPVLKSYESEIPFVALKPDELKIPFVVPKPIDRKFNLVFTKMETVRTARMRVAEYLEFELDEITLMFGGKSFKDEFVLGRLRLGTQPITVYVKQKAEVLLLSYRGRRDG
jgi:hypothetical protein